MHTSRIGEMPDGYLGFWLLAGIPFLFFAVRFLSGNGLELIVIGVAMILGVSSTTQYARYWLPAIPFLLIPMFLALGSLCRWARFSERNRAAVVPALILFGILLLPTLIWTSRRLYTWDAYTGKMSQDQYTTIAFPGYKLVKEIKTWIGPDDGVLCSGYTGVYAVAARSFEFPFWHATLNGIRSPKMMRDFFKNNRIRYWLVNLEGADEVLFFNQNYGVLKDLWTNERMAASLGSTALFDVSDEPNLSRSKSVSSHTFPAKLQSGSSKAFDDSGWFDVKANSKGIVEQGNDSILVPADHIITHDIGVTTETQTCCIKVEMRGAKSGHYGVVMRLDWFDVKGHNVGMESVSSVADKAYANFQGWIFAKTPATATYGRLMLRPWNSLPVSVRATTVEFWNR